MYPRIVRQIAPMGETTLSTAVEASGCCQCIWEFMGYQISDYRDGNSPIAAR
jgi:hypothetical protein